VEMSKEDDLNQEIERLRQDNHILESIIDSEKISHKAMCTLVHFWQNQSKFWTILFFVLLSIGCALVISLLVVLNLNEVWVGDVCLSCWGK
jgi:hypothetical protein